MREVLLSLVFLFGGVSAATAQEKASPSDDEVAKILIAESIAAYSGSCPCPYNRARNGSRCGKRSAYSRPGGASPLCYRRDVSDEMIKAWRAER
jgi:hypothetical protein